MRAVICCDQGAPAEMVRDALTVGRALMERGHTVVYIVGDPVALVEAAGSWTPNDLYQAPVRRAGPNLVMKPPTMDGFADLMATIGFDDKQTLVALAALWNRQLLTVKPDAIIGFYTPVLWLVGPSHAPTFALGGGLTLPPVLAALSEILDRCTSILYGVPAFDPYLQVRRVLSTGLLGEEPTPTVPPAKERLAVFLDVYCPNIEQIILALASLEDISIDVCVSGATAGMRRFLEQHPNVKVWKDYASLLAEAPSSSALVHHGVQDVAQRCISLGRPQLIIPWTREQEILNASIQWMSFTWSKSPSVSLDEMAGTFSAILRDHSLTVAAQHHARQLADANLPDALPGIIEQIEAARSA
jgi:hypothetical protein